MAFIVAEIGVNWNGDFDIVREMMEKSKEIGFNAVKFQSYSSDMIKEHPKRQILSNSAVTEKNIDEIDKIAKTIGIEWFSTPMFLDAVDFLEPYVNRYKIREVDGRILLKNKRSDLTDKILSKNKEVITSCYSSPKESIYYKNSQIKWLYCVPKYPCKLEELNFTILNEFNGYSNHCNQIIAPIAAAVLGAEIIEIHITSDKQSNFIDNPVSFDYKESFEIIKQIKNIAKIQK